MDTQGIIEQAEQKFCEDTAKRLAALLTPDLTKQDLDRVSKLIQDCSSGDDLLSRVSCLLKKIRADRKRKRSRELGTRELKRKSPSPTGGSGLL